MIIAIVTIAVATAEHISCAFPEGNYKTINYALKQTLNPVIIGDQT